jgi:HemY protein
MDRQNMLKLILFVIVAAAIAWVGAWLADHPGNVVIDWLDWRIETSLSVLLVATLLLCAATILVFEAGRWLFGLPRRVRERRALARILDGYRALTTGLVAAAAGDPAMARYYARRAGRLLGESDPSLHLLEAQRAQLEGDEEQALRQFQAMLKTPETELLGLRGLLAHAVKAGDYADALELARRAYRRNPTTPWVLVTLFDLLTRLGEWQEALQVLIQMADLKLVPRDVARRRRAILYMMLAEGAERSERPDEALRHLKRAFQLVPGFAPVAVRLARFAVGSGRPRLARRVLERSWKIEAHPDVARAYLGLFSNRTRAEQLRAARRLQALKPFEPLAHVLVAEAEMAAGGFEAARRALIRAEQLGASSRVFLVRAELERLAGAAEETVREWRARAEQAPADRAWVCEDTGEVFPEWQPFGASGRFDAVLWTVPPRVARLGAGEAPASFIPHRAPTQGTSVVPATEASPPAPSPLVKATAPGRPRAERAAPEAEAAVPQPAKSAA